MRSKKVLILATALGLSSAFAVAPAFAATDTGVQAASSSCGAVTSYAGDADWRTEDGAPTYAVDGLVFRTPAATDKQNWFHNRSVPLAGLSGLGYSLSNTGGPQTAYDLEVLTTGSAGSFATFVYEPYVNGAPLGGDGTVETYDSIEDGLWWSSKIKDDTLPGSQAKPVTLAALSALYPQALVISNGLGQGKNNAGSVTTVHSVTFDCVTTTFTQAVPTHCDPEAAVSTNLDTDGWTAVGDVTWVDGGVQIDVPGDWAEAGVERDFDGTLAEVGDDVDFVATPSQYVGVHLTLSNGADLVYEQEPTYTGKWWSTTDLHVTGGLGYSTLDTLENIVAANPTVTVTKVRVLYTNPVAASTRISSVTVGCVTTAFAAAPTQQPSTSPSQTPSASATPTTSASSIPAPSEADVTAGNATGVTLSGRQVPGGTLTVTVSGVTPGTHVGAFVFSTPTFLGEKVVGADRTFQVVLPTSLAAGAHRLVVTDVNGAVLGWAPITIAASGGSLASTGSDALAGVLAAAIALVAGAGLVLVRRNARA